MNNLEKEINQSYIDYISSHMDYCNAKSKDMYEFLEHSSLFYDGEIKSKTLMIPKVYSKETFDRLSDIMTTTHNICNKIVDRYLEDENYRKIFPFPKELVDLILIPRGYKTTLPMSRYDIFLNEETGDFGFCEFNTDGTSGMDENTIHDMSYIDNPAHQYVLSKYDIRPFELYECWIDEFFDLYHSWKSAGDMPHVAIIDFPGAGRFKEFKEFARRFQRRGAKAYVCDITSLKYDGDCLRTADGYKIDAIYRRACTGDVLENLDKVQPFLNALRDEKVFIAGAFCTQIVHNKWIFSAMHHDTTATFLTPEEKAFVTKHVPKTVMFSDPAQVDMVKENKDAYILKTQDSYASFGVLAGVEFTKDEWVAHVDRCFNNNYLLQDFAPQYRTDNIDFIFGNGQFKKYLNMTGLYCYNGKLTGFFNRQSDGAIIRTYTNERTVPTYLIH